MTVARCFFVDPGVHTVDAFDVGHAVAVSRSCAVDPDVRRLDDVIINRDEPLQILFHGYSLGPLCDRPPARVGPTGTARLIAYDAQPLGHYERALNLSSNTR